MHQGRKSALTEDWCPVGSPQQAWSPKTQPTAGIPVTKLQSCRGVSSSDWWGVGGLVGECQSLTTLGCVGLQGNLCSAFCRLGQEYTIIKRGRVMVPPHRTMSLDVAPMRVYFSPPAHLVGVLPSPSG
jgi:hypothetical protein